jgi:hypothetical protein
VGTHRLTIDPSEAPEAAHTLTATRSSPAHENGHLRRVLPVSARPGEGHLAEAIADVSAGAAGTTLHAAQQPFVAPIGIGRERPFPIRVAAEPSTSFPAIYQTNAVEEFGGRVAERLAWPQRPAYIGLAYDDRSRT